jgi:hypothetical protein
MFKLCPFFPLLLYLVANGLRTIQFLLVPGSNPRQVRPATVINLRLAARGVLQSWGLDIIGTVIPTSM